MRNADHSRKADRKLNKRIADTGPRAHAQLAGFDRSFHRTGLITLPSASRPIMIKKKTKDTKRKNATRIDSTLIR